MANLRTLGIRGENLPSKKTLTVQSSDFLIGGIIGILPRQFAKAFEVKKYTEVEDIFRSNVDNTKYGYDVIKGFFDNVVGVEAKAYIVSHVGHTGAAIDAVTATKNLVDGSAANTLRIDDAYEGTLGYGANGNNTGYKVTNGYRFVTAANGDGLATDTFVVVDSVAGIYVGDLMQFIATGGGGATVYKKITAIDENAKKVHFTGAFHGAANMKDNDTAKVLGFRLQIYRRDVRGVVSEVESELGKIYCTMESEVSDYYVQNVFAYSKNVKVTDLASASVLNLSFPIDVATVTYLASGADGTAPTSASHYAADLLLFDDLPIRFLTNAETSTVAIQQAGETYCKGRWDNPKWICVLPENQNKAQLISYGNGYQRRDDVLQVNVANWLKVTDPFSSSALSPYRNVPNVGHVMGAWIRCIGLKGIHNIPATSDITLYGVNGVVGDTFLSDSDRTDLGEAGINVIQYRKGIGYQIRNFFTPSTSTEYMFANGILMRDYIKISIVDSLTDTENEPNTFDRIKTGRMAILKFLYNLWNVGSNGNTPTGETFGQTSDDEGNATEPEDHFECVADSVNNPQSKINLGERNYDIYFSYPAPAGSIRIRVGILLK